MLDGDLAMALASMLRLEWDDSERELFSPLIDATIMRVEQEQLDEITRPIVGTLWDEVRPLVADELRDQAQRDDVLAEVLEDALADLELGAQSRLAAYTLQQAALDLADEVFFLEECLDCIEEGLAHAPARASAALVDRAAAALALHGDAEFASARPTETDRRTARAHIARMAALGSDGLPRLSQALAELAAEPLPSPPDDRVLRAVVSRRLAAGAELN